MAVNDVRTVRTRVTRAGESRHAPRFPRVIDVARSRRYDSLAPGSVERLLLRLYMIYNIFNIQSVAVFHFRFCQHIQYIHKVNLFKC